MKISPTGYWYDSVNHAYSRTLAQWICQYLKGQEDKVVWDFGCGWGFYLRELQNAGFTRLTGFEGEIPENRVFDHVLSQDLTIPFVLPWKGNVICLEVGEHIPEEYQQIFINNICNSCDGKLILSWGELNQPGDGHINCRDNAYIISEITKRGMTFLFNETLSARAVITEECEWFKNTVMIFKVDNEV